MFSGLAAGDCARTHETDISNTNEINAGRIVSPLRARFCHYLAVLGTPHDRICAVRAKTEVTVYAGLGFLFVTLLGVGVFAERSVAKLIDESNGVVQTVEIKKSLEEMSSLLAELSTTATDSVSREVRETQTK